MRKILFGIVFFIVAGILASCSNQTNTDQAIEIEEFKTQIEQLSLENEALHNTVGELGTALEAMQNANSDYSTILAKDIEKYPQTLYKTSTLDIDEDGQDEVIELFVNAQKMENGVIGWDDGQTWLLIVKDGETTYPLFDDFVQMGTIDFSTTTFDKKPGIVMLKTWQHDRIVQRFTYDHDAKGYVKHTIYKKENMGQQYNQTASYAFFEDAYELMKLAFTDKAEIALAASESELQDFRNRLAIYDPIYAELLNAQRLFVIVGELNPELQVTLGSALDLLNEMVRNLPTLEQMKQLRDIHAVFIESDSGDLVVEEENKIHPNIMEKMKKINFILKGN